ncbi:MAG: hypothetical protein E5W00_05360, partial [Mesorhizobium sp.]
RALARANGNVSAAAANLGISRATLHRKLARFGLTRFRTQGIIELASVRTLKILKRETLQVLSE